MSKVRSLGVGAAVAIAAVPLLGVALVLPSPAFFSGDSGAKLLQARAIATASRWPCTIPYPGREFDPEGELLPPSLRASRDGAVSIFPVLFALPSAALVVVGGERLLSLLPFAGAAFCALLAGRLAIALGASRRAPLAGAAALLATPLAFYSVAYWEHSLAAALVLGAAVVVAEASSDSPGPWFAAGVLAGLAAWTRTELVVLLPLAALPLTRRRVQPALAAVGGFVTGLLTGSLAQWAVTGTWLPLHVVQHVDRGFLALSFVKSRAGGVASLLVPDPWTGAALVVWLAAVAVAGSDRARPGAVVRTVTVLGTLAPLAATILTPAFRVLGGARPAAAFHGQAATTTWVVLAAMPVVLAGAPAPPDRRRFWVGIAAAWLTVAPVAALPVYGGFQWGARFLLPAVILLAVLVCSAPLADGEWGRVQRAALAAALVAGVAVQGLGLALLRHVAIANQIFAERVAELTTPGAVVVTDTFFLPELAAPIWNGRCFLHTTSSAAAERLLERLERSNVTSWTYAWVGGAGGGLFDLTALASRGWAVVGEDSRDAVNRTLHVLRLRRIGQPRAPS
jgi:hypothetical protein